MVNRNLSNARVVGPVLLAFLLLSLLVIGHAIAAPAAGGDVERVSVDSLGAEADGPSQGPVVSADGRFVAFHSEATNLVENDLNDLQDVFIHDRQNGEMKRVSIASDGFQGNGPSRASALSANGSLVVFESEAENLVADDGNEETDIFVRDRLANQTTRVSVGMGGVEGNGPSVEAAISGDGRYVAFASTADNLVADDTNGESDVFLHDRQTGTTIRVSVGLGGAEANRWSHRPAMSANGRFVGFISLANNLVEGDTNGKPDVFVFDRDTGGIERVSLSNSGLQATGPSYRVSLSADGRYVAFDASVAGLVAGDTNDKIDIFVRDRQAATTVRVSVSSEGAQADDDSFDPHMAAGGRYVAFWSNADNLVPDDSGKFTDVFVADLQTGRIGRVNVTANGAEAADGSFAPSISADGEVVAYTSFAPNLVEADKNNTWDIFTIETLTSISGQVTQQSGGLPVANVSVSAGPGMSAVTDADGNYTIPDLLPGQYQVLAAATDLGFAPPSRDVTLPPAAVDQDFAAFESKTYTISGTITDSSSGQGIAAVLVSDGAGRTALTNAQGQFTLPFVTAGAYTLTPSKQGYTFTPASRLVVVSNANRGGQDFVGQTSFSIVGHVTLLGSGAPLAGVTIATDTGLEAVTDGDGIYLLDGLEPGAYVLTAVRDGYEFTPPQREVVVPPNAAGQDFVAAPEVKRVLLPLAIR